MVSRDVYIRVRVRVGVRHLDVIDKIKVRG